MIGIVVPVHNEEQLLAGCLEALIATAVHARSIHGEVRVVVVLDSCSDRSASIVAGYDVHVLTVDARNVGMARNAGAEYLIAAGACWLAFTDADSRVSPEWLCRQLELEADAVCGSIAVDDWFHHSEIVRLRFQAVYRDCDDHRHIHGANLGVAAWAYRLAGGFPPLTTGEDVAMVHALIAIGANICWSAKPRVHTSARREARCKAGFGDYLLNLE